MSGSPLLSSPIETNVLIVRLHICFVPWKTPIWQLWVVSTIHLFQGYVWESWDDRLVVHQQTLQLTRTLRSGDLAQNLCLWEMLWFETYWFPLTAILLSTRRSNGCLRIFYFHLFDLKLLSRISVYTNGFTNLGHLSFLQQICFCGVLTTTFCAPKATDGWSFISEKFE